jgi:hypothetical protein
MDAELEKIVGAKPLRIVAEGVFGVKTTDPIINREDAMLIISSDANINLLREAKVVFVLESSVLKGQL